MAGAFEWFEGSGWRAWLGAWLVVVLAVLRRVLGLVVDFGQVEREIRAQELRERQRAVDGGKKSV